MKKIILMLLLTSGLYAQKQVFNVQHYCIDEKPFAKGQCDIEGNEYSFVFLNQKKKEVVFFLTEIKFIYQIVSSKKTTDQTVYLLKNDSDEVEMRINNKKTKIEFLSPNRHIVLKVGKSTKE